MHTAPDSKCGLAGRFSDAHAVPWRRANRRGISMMLVMTSLSATLVLTYAFVQTQTISTSVNQNTQSGVLALQAAQSGATAALQAMQSPAWPGVTSTLSSVVQVDNSGVTSYLVQFQPYPAPVASVQSANGAVPVQPAVQTAGPDAALTVNVLSTGTWASKSGNGQTVSHQVLVRAQLQPRLPGRTVTAADNAAAADTTTNPVDFDTIQSYAVFASGGHNTLTLDPGDRIEGNVWLRVSDRFFQSPGWSSNIRGQVLQDLGTRFVTTTNGQTAFQYPHPLSGVVTYLETPNSRTRSDMALAGIPWSQGSSQPVTPQLTWSSLSQYQLFAGGFTYSAQPVSSTLQNVVLRPGPQNPLGVFLANGPVSIQSNVTIQGTLVSTDTISVYGSNVQITSFNWLNSQGQPLVPNATLFPRLPALIAENVTFDDGAAAIVEGAIVAQGAVSGGGGRYQYVVDSNVSLAGAATSSPLEQPYSTVQLQGAVNLSAISGGGVFAIWLQRGTGSGDWFPIMSVNPESQQLTVLGETTNTAAVNFIIKGCRRQYTDIRGPVLGSTIQLSGNNDWNLWGLWWTELYQTWQWAAQGQSSGPLLFTQWLGNPNNFYGWDYPYSQYGFSLEPTFSTRSNPNIHYSWSPPLFQPYAPVGGAQTSAGYRWNVLSWQEID